MTNTIESPPLLASHVSSQLSKVVSKVGDIVKNHHYTNTEKKGAILDTAVHLNENISEVLYYNALEHESMCHLIAERIESCLKDAKSQILGCCEVLIPCSLTVQIAQDVIGMSESEPCGLRGCLLYINFEDKDHCRPIGEIKFGDRTTVPTFEMCLYLKRNNYSWLSIIALKILKNFGRQSLVISDGYKLSKRKLFRSVNIS
jgi:hypothetical protein